jgi:hypothetical protein
MHIEVLAAISSLVALNRDGWYMTWECLAASSWFLVIPFVGGENRAQAG